MDKINIIQHSPIKSTLAAEYFNRGVDCLNADDPQGALKAFNQVLVLYPKDPEAILRRGLAYARLGQHRKAISDFDVHLSEFPDNPVALTRRGVSLAELEHFHTAFRDFDRAIELNPDFVLAWYYRGMAHIRQNDIKNAIQDLGKVIELDPQNKDAYYFLALCKTRELDFTGALQVMDQLAVIDPAYPDLHGVRGHIQIELGNLPAAVEEFTSAIEKDPQNIEYFCSRCQLHYLLEHTEQALEDLYRAIRISPELTVAAMSAFHQTGIVT